MHDTQEKKNETAEKGNGASAVKMADGYEGNGLRARNLLRNALFGILRQLQSGNGDSDTLDYMQYRIEGLYADVLRCF